MHWATSVVATTQVAEKKPASAGSQFLRNFTLRVFTCDGPSETCGNRQKCLKPKRLRGSAPGTASPPGPGPIQIPLIPLAYAPPRSSGALRRPLLRLKTPRELGSQRGSAPSKLCGKGVAGLVLNLYTPTKTTIKHLLGDAPCSAMGRIRQSDCRPNSSWRHVENKANHTPEGELVQPQRQPQPASTVLQPEGLPDLGRLKHWLSSGCDDTQSLRGASGPRPGPRGNTVTLTSFTYPPWQQRPEAPLEKGRKVHSAVGKQSQLQGQGKECSSWPSHLAA